MNELFRSALGVWWLWLFLGVCAMIAWKTPKRKGKNAGTDPSAAFHNGMATPSSDTHLSDCSLHPYDLSNQYRNRF